MKTGYKIRSERFEKGILSFILTYKRQYCYRGQNLVQVTKINGWSQKIKQLDQIRLLKSDPKLYLSQMALCALKHDMTLFLAM